MELNPLGLIDKMALQHLQSKKLQTSFSHYDIWLDQHAYAFTVAKMMDEDLLAETRQALVDALENGTSFREFKQRLKPFLMSRGWWGEQVMIDPMDDEPKMVQLGSTRRLKTIFQTNIATAHASARWQRIQANKRGLPYLRYNASHAQHQRNAHKRYYGLVLPVEHPIWHQIFPPNGYGCKCSVTQLTRGQAERAGISQEPDFEFVEVENPRTGEVVRVPRDIEPSFAHNHANRQKAVLDLATEKHGQVFETSLINQLYRYINVRDNMDLPNFNIIRQAEKTAQAHNPNLFASSRNIIAEGQKIADEYADVIEYWENEGKPHYAIAEIMQREGVELAGKVTTKGSNREIQWELSQAVKMYPKDWVEKSNQLGAILVEGANGRAFYSYPYQNDLAQFIRNTLNNKSKSHFHKSLQNRLLELGDSLISVNLKHTVWEVRKSSIIHEFAHRMQTVMPDLQDVFLRLFLESTKKDKAISRSELSGIQLKKEQEEWYKLDHFPLSYYGRMYKPNNSQNPQPLELMTMIFQALLGGGEYYQYLINAENRKFFYFGLAVLVRWRA